MSEQGRARRFTGVAAVAAAALAPALLIPAAFAQGDLLWTKTGVPNPEHTTALNGVAAVAADDAWAVGNHYAGLTGSVVMHWDGRRWTETKHPEGAYLSAVDAVAADDVWAVGQGADAPFDHGVAIHWDGGGWREAPRPDLGTDASALVDVSAAGDGTVWAGGHMTNEPEAASGSERPGEPASTADGWTHAGFVQRWDGTEWTVTRPPVPEGAGYVDIAAVHAVSATEVWVAGTSVFSDPDTGLTIPHPWAARYLDGDWTTMPIPDVDEEGSGKLTGITESGDGGVALAGHNFDRKRPVPMVLAWDGDGLTRRDFTGTRAFVDAVAADGHGGLLLAAGTETEGWKPALLRVDGDRLTPVAKPATAEFANLTALASIPGTSRIWVVGTNLDYAGMPTGPVAAYAELG